MLFRSNNITLSDSFNLVQYWAAYSDNVTPSESLIVTITKPIVDDSNVTITEAVVLNVGKNIDNTDSTISFEESGSGLLLNYTDAVGASGYFSEIYAGGTVITF